VTPPTQFARPVEAQGQGSTLATVGVVAAVGGLAIGAGSRLAKNIGLATPEEPKSEKPAGDDGKD